MANNTPPSDPVAPADSGSGADASAVSLTPVYGRFGGSYEMAMLIAIMFELLRAGDTDSVDAINGVLLALSAVDRAVYRIEAARNTPGEAEAIRQGEQARETLAEAWAAFNAYITEQD